MERTTGSSNLLRAAAIGSHHSIRRLVERGEDVNAMAAQEHTPLFLAVEHNHPVAVYTLLQAGADALRRNRQGFNALHIAAQRGDPESLVVLLHHEPDSINVPAEDGRTPLHLAAAKDHVLCVQILLICGCDVTIVDEYGCTAADYAATHKNPGSHFACAYGLCLTCSVCRRGTAVDDSHPPAHGRWSSDTAVRDVSGRRQSSYCRCAWRLGVGTQALD